MAKIMLLLPRGNKKQAGTTAAIRQLIDPKGEYAEKIKETTVDIMIRLISMDITVCPKCGSQLIACPLPVEAESVQVAVLDTS